MNCPICGETVRSNAKYCVQCGAMLPLKTEQDYCPRCHRRVLKDAKYCTFCAAPLHKSPKEPRFCCRRCGNLCEPGKTLCTNCRKHKVRTAILTGILLFVLLAVFAAAGIVMFAPELIPWRETGNGQGPDAGQKETSGGEETVVPTTISLDREYVSLKEGDSVLVTANLDIDLADWDGSVEWSSSKEGTVVDIIPLGKNMAQIGWMAGGECTVLAVVSGEEDSGGNELYASCTVQCLDPEPKIEFPVGTVEYNGHHYKVYLEETDWESAQTACEALGGHLATITSEEENQFVYELACTYSTELAFLLGGTDQAEEGTFVWVTGEPFEYTNWGYLNQPDNYRGYKDQDYITLLTFDQTGKYHDDSGESWGTHASEWDDKDGQSNPYICEWDF